MACAHSTSHAPDSPPTVSRRSRRSRCRTAKYSKRPAARRSDTCPRSTTAAITFLFSWISRNGTARAGRGPRMERNGQRTGNWAHNARLRSAQNVKPAGAIGATAPAHPNQPPDTTLPRPNKQSSHLRYPDIDPPKNGAMTELASGMRWIRLPVPGGLSHINVWLIPDHDGWTLVDTGMGIDPVTIAWEGLLERLDATPIRRIIVTHHHPDHFGQAAWL